MKDYSVYWEISKKESGLRYPYYYDEPCAVTFDKFEELTKLQHLLYKSFKFFLPRFDQYEHIITYSDVAKKVVSHYDLKDVKIGFYRPDFLMDDAGGIKLCELGCRYYEVYWGHGISEYIMEKRNTCKNNVNGKRIIENVMDGAYKWLEGLDKELVILKGRDREGDIRFYRPYFEKMGTKIHYIYPDNLDENLELLKNLPVLSAFSQMELEALSDNALLAITKSNCLNPLTTIFLFHDKRFLAVLWNDAFREEALGVTDAAFLKRFLTPSYTHEEGPSVWNDALNNKDKYILKPYLLGKSEGIIPGPLVTEEEWRKAFESKDIRKMMLQEWVKQKPFKASIDGKKFTDYGTGMLLCLEDELHGLGQFRMSSCEVINYIKDDRKMAPWIVEDPSNYDGNYFLL